MRKKKELNQSEAKQERVRILSGVGDEPKFTGLSWSQLDLVKALNYYAANTDFSKMKEWAVAFVKERWTDLIPIVKAAPDHAFMTYGPLCRMHSRGFKLDESYLNRIREYFSSLVIQEEEKPKVRRTKEKLNKSQESFDEALDNTLATCKVQIPTLDPNDDLKSIKSYAERELNSLKESPEYFKLNQVAPLKQFFKGVKDKCEEILNAKKKKSPVVQKRKTPAEIVKAVRFKKSEPSLKLTSIQPINILDCRKAYVYDVEKRRLIRFVASNANFTFTGTTLQNIDLEKSVSKVVRKPEEFFHGRDLSISAMNKAFDAIRAVERPINTGRFNEEYIILSKS